MVIATRNCVAKTEGPRSAPAFYSAISEECAGVSTAAGKFASMAPLPFESGMIAAGQFGGFGGMGAGQSLWRSQRDCEGPPTPNRKQKPRVARLLAREARVQV